VIELKGSVVFFVLIYSGFRCHKHLMGGVNWAFEEEGEASESAIVGVMKVNKGVKRIS